MFRITTTGLFAAAMLTVMTSFSAASPLGSGTQGSAAHVAVDQVEQVQYRYHGGPGRHVRGGYYRHHGYRHHHGYYRHHRGWRGDGVAAGVAAGAAGALAIGALAASGAFSPPPAAAIAPPRRQWCMDRFRSYNPEDGTYIDIRGRVRYCG